MTANKQLNGKLRLTLLDAAGELLGESVDIRLQHLVLSDLRVVSGADASEPILIENLHPAPQGFYKLEVDPASYRPHRRFINIRSSGVTEVEIAFEDQEIEEPELVLVGDDGEARTDLEVGEPLTVSAGGLRRAAAHEVRLLDADGALLAEQRILSDREGVIPPTNLWPQLGLDDPRSARALTVEEAEQEWAGRRLGIEIRYCHKTVAAGTVPIPERFERPLVLSTDVEGRVRNGFEVGAEDVVVSGLRLDLPETARVYMVARQRDWRIGDAFTPVLLRSGRSAIADVELDGGAFRARLARAREAEPGAYDFIIRHIRYGYEDDEDLFLRPSDIVGLRTVTGLVVREEFMASKFVAGGCANLQQISGRKLFGAPYFQFTNVFPVGADVWGALDPNALDPGHQGKMVALYVVPHKTAAQWTADNSLNHLAVLGGNAAVTQFKTQTGCINHNDHLLWPNATDEGEYDIVADFGNNTSTAASFLPDDDFDQPLDMIDGYVVPGFRIVPDPVDHTTFNHAGTFTYNDGNTTVDDDSFYDPYLGHPTPALSPVIVPQRAEVYFPADAAGATLPSQISAAQSSYPLFLVVHGNSTDTSSYTGYSYLLEHFAKNGFIAASIHLKFDMKGHGRAEMVFKHIALLQTKFGSSLANNVALMGHSRGGEAVVRAALINQADTLGHNIAAVISLAPTDQYGRVTLKDAAAAPYLVIYGSMDGDVAGGAPFGSPTPPSRTGFSLYDRAKGAAKSMVFVHGSTHGRYNEVWGDTDITAGWSQLDPPDYPKLINVDAHEKIAKGYMTAFCRQHLLGESQWAGIFRGEWVPPAVEQADAGKVRLYVQTKDTSADLIDNFEGIHTATSWQTSTAGDTVDDAGTLPVDPVEDQLHNVDAHSPHDTGGLLLRWDGTGDQLTFGVPVADKDVSGFDAVSFRITQKVDSPSNPAGIQDLYATLTDTGSQSRKIRVSKFAEIPEPHKRNRNQYTKSAMRTVRIPLHAYTIAVAGKQDVDLANIDHVRFDFGVKATGEIEIDSVEFTH